MSEPGLAFVVVARMARRFESFSRGAGVAVAAGGGLVLAGWLLGIELLAQPVPGTVSMKANTAVAFILSGGSLWLLHSATRAGRVGCMAAAGGAIALGAITLAQYVTGWDARIDEALFTDPETAYPHPGRMSPLTASLFVALGAATLCLKAAPEKLAGAAQLAAFATLLLALASLVGYIHNANSLYHIAQYTPIAVHTALLFAVLSLGVACARPSHGLAALFASSGLGGATIRTLWLPSIVAMLALAWLAELGGSLGLYGGGFGAAMSNLLVIAVLSALMWRAALNLEGADQRRSVAEGESRRLNAELESRVAQRTAQLAAVARELESFSYSVSHDLRGPLRSIDGFSQVLLEDYADRLDADGKDALMRIQGASARMDHLIDDLLRLARITHGALARAPFDLAVLARAIADSLQKNEPARPVRWEIAESLPVVADEAFMEIAMRNLLDNAWKFTAGQSPAVIRVGAAATNGHATYFVADNGAGFDMAHAESLFGAFQRLHPPAAFPGTGLGLAIVRRIVERHGGQIRAEGRPGEGAIFHFTLGNPAGPSDSPQR